jgi:ketosteroid isomerase-like protein
MSTENVDVVRGHWQAWEDDRDIERLVAGWAPSVEWDMTHYAGWAGAPGYRGHGDVLAFLVEYMAPWTGYRTQTLRFVDGGERVLVEVRESGRLSGEATDRTWAMVCTVRGGTTVRVEMFSDVGEAERSLRGEGPTGPSERLRDP